MNPMAQILEIAAGLNRKIVLSEGEDPRVIAAAIDARRQGLARIVLVGDGAGVASALADAGGQDLDGVEIHDPTDSDLSGEMAEAYHNLRKHKGVTPEAAADAVAEL